jgi:outer membrane protein assembly factor BamD (BamD/ComL family)
VIRNLFITAVVLGLTLIGIHGLLQNSNLMALAERLPGRDSAPEVEYYAGQMYYNAQDYDTAGTYFRYVFSRYPSSSYAERAHVFWLECLSQRLYHAPAEAAAECKAFLQQYPQSAYAPRVRKLEEICERATLH